ncbi:hypothetical protein GGF31_003415 [Allomyces arbusculus]|nr:hypothetical protein GGF31_003415 [Allomyces arbusculus]
MPSSTASATKTATRKASKKNVAATPVADAPVADTSSAQAADEVHVPRPGSGERSFTVMQVLCTGQDTTECVKGRFISKNPAGACRKAANKIFKKLFQDGESAPLEIHIRETTKGSKNGEFKYSATRSLIDKREVSFKTQDGQTTAAIPFKYDIRVTSLNGKKPAVNAVVEPAIEAVAA